MAQMENVEFDTEDLGHSDAPWLIFGGPYSNLHATRAVRQEARRMGVAPQNTLCTGDVVAYCADPAGTVAEIRDWGCAVLAGNCEQQIASGAADCGCGFEDGSACDLLSDRWYAHARAAIDQDTRAWMASLPDALTFTHHGKTCLALHGGITDVSRFLWSVSPEVAFSEELTRMTVTPDIVFAGHSGIPFVRQIGDVAWINAGVIGMPPHDCASETRFAILEDGCVTFHKLRYDWQGAQKAMQQAGLTQGYDQSLGTGIWPSQDVLPPVLRRTDRAAA